MRQSVPKLHSYRPKAGTLAEPPVPAEAHGHMTVHQALSLVVKEGLTDVLVLGYASDGAFVALSSYMSRKDALWLIEKARQHTITG